MRVPPEERERKVLEFIDSSGFPMPPKVVFRGMRYRDETTVSYSAMKNILSRLAEQGDLIQVSKGPIKDRRIVELPPDSDERGYYWITAQGRERIDAAE